MPSPRYWSLRTTWDPLPAAHYSRHAVEVPETVVARLAAGRRWSGRAPSGFESSRRGLLEDFPWCFAPVWSTRAVQALEPLLARCGEFLPVTVRRRSAALAQQYYCFNCVCVIDALEVQDVPRSAWLAKGVPDPSYPWEFSFRNVPRGTHAFRCRHRMDLLVVSSAVARVLEKSSLVGWALVDLTGRVPGILSPLPRRSDT